jgi:hypothetical protein
MSLGHNMKQVITLSMLFGLLIVGSDGFCEDRTVLTDQSYGVVRFGSKLLEVEKKLAEKAKGHTGDQGCDFVTFKKYPGVKFMVEKGVVTRADVTDSSIPNSLGIKNGTTLDEVKRIYPKVIVEPHQYDPTGHYLIFKSKDGKRAIVFEEGDGKITDVRAGMEPSVEYVEGCL